MADPVLIEFVQVAESTVERVTIGIQWIFQNPINQVYNVPENAGRRPMIAVAANHRLKTGRQKPHVIQFQVSRTNRAGEQIRENSGQSQHPDFEITCREIDWASLLQRAY